MAKSHTYDHLLLETHIRLALAAQHPQAATDPKAWPAPSEGTYGCYTRGVSTDHPKNWEGPHCLHQWRAHPITSCKILGAHCLGGPGDVSDGRLSWPWRDIPWLSKTAQIFIHTATRASAENQLHFFRWTQMSKLAFSSYPWKKQIKIAVYLPAGDEYNYIPTPLFLPPKKKNIIHCRKICPSFSEASSCQERKAADWQRKGTAKELPEHCTK